MASKTRKMSKASSREKRTRARARRVLDVVVSDNVFDGLGVAPPLVLTWADDPRSGLPPLAVEAQNLAVGRLPIQIREAAPLPREYPTGTSEFRYWTASAALARGVNFWENFLPASASWRTGPRLPVTLDQGVFPGSFYRREIGLEFFHDSANGQTIFACESPELVCHELGHAILDTIRPEIYNVLAFEQAAFHEAFGDISALLCMLQLTQVRSAVLAETGGSIQRDSRVSRFAESFGWLLHQKNPSLSSAQSLRNAANAFIYQPPSTCPPGGPHTTLTSQSHNFCRVFTGAFLEMLSGVLMVIAQQPRERDLQEATALAARILVGAIISAPVAPAYLAQIAGHMVGHAGRVDASPAIRERLVAVVSSAFVRRGILSVNSAFGAGALSSMVDGHGAVDSVELQPVTVHPNLFGIGGPEIFARAPIQKLGQVDVRATGINVEESLPLSAEITVHNFLEFLLSRGQLDLGEQGKEVIGLTHPQVFKTHALVTTKEGVFVERLAFGCGFEEICN